MLHYTELMLEAGEQQSPPVGCRTFIVQVKALGTRLINQTWACLRRGCIGTKTLKDQ